jgi:hypothetical protein
MELSDTQLGSVIEPAVYQWPLEQHNPSNGGSHFGVRQGLAR